MLTLDTSEAVRLSNEIAAAGATAIMAASVLRAAAIRPDWNPANPDQDILLLVKQAKIEAALAFAHFALEAND